jgi:hypothetical protein
LRRIRARQLPTLGQPEGQEGGDQRLEDQTGGPRPDQQDGGLPPLRIPQQAKLIQQSQRLAVRIHLHEDDEED